MRALRDNKLDSTTEFEGELFTGLPGSCLKTGQHSIFVIIRKIKRIIYVAMLDTLFIEDFIDSMEEYFHF